MKTEKPAPNGASFSGKSIESRRPETTSEATKNQAETDITYKVGAPRAVDETTVFEGAGEKKPSLRDALITSKDLADMNLLPRPNILGEWMKEGDLGYVFAPRGHGKTWLTMLIGNAIAEGKALGEWGGGEKTRRVVYFDAEMNLPDVQGRAKLIGINSVNFEWLQNELVFEYLRRGLNIAELVDQAALAEMLNDGDVFIIDNLSTAASGMAENDNDAFDHVKSWLLELRGRKITVIIVHHAGRNGQMRGASRREDMAHWIISLKDDSGDGEMKAWVTHFQKCRNCQAMEAPTLRWTIATNENSLTYTCEKHSGPETMIALISDGIERACDLAEEMGVTPGCISKWAKKLENAGRIKIKERKYTLP
jgi:hypothetical protein